MIDKVDIRIPWLTPFSREIGDVIAQLRHGHVYPFRPAKFYSCVGDLRESHGIDAILHLNYKFSRDHKTSSKLEIIDAGKKTIVEMAEIIRRIINIDPFECELMRLDLASDIFGVPVHVVRDLARFRYKRFATRIEKSFEIELEFRAMGTADSQTFNAGRRPNFIRIYNKIKELYGQWLKLKQRCERFNKQMKSFDMSAEQLYYGARFCPTFEGFCLAEGFECFEGLTVTRIERQIGAAQFPEELRLFGDLRNAHLFNPFTAVKILPSGVIRSFEQPPPGVSIRDWLAAMGLDRLRQEFGNSHQACSYVQKYGNGNGKRVLESLFSIMPPERPPITETEIFEAYARSTERQVTGAKAINVYLPPRHEETNQITRGGIKVLPATREDRWP